MGFMNETNLCKLILCVTAIIAYKSIYVYVNKN